MTTSEEDYKKQFDEAFFKDGYNLADMFLSNGFTRENLFIAQRQLYKTIDELNDSFLTRNKTEGNSCECRMGCCVCCNQTVLATPYELLYLADFIKKKFRDDALAVIIERAENKKKSTSELKIDRLLRYKQPCPLLHSTGGYCRVYQARPMACRIFLSASVKSCEDDFLNPEDDSIFPKLFDMPLRAGRMLNEGFHSRIRKGRMNNLQAFENTVEEGLLTALKEDSFDRWIKGEKVFRKIE